jgi:hypothetical protein
VDEKIVINYNEKAKSEVGKAISKDKKAESSEDSNDEAEVEQHKYEDKTAKTSEMEAKSKVETTNEI